MKNTQTVIHQSTGIDVVGDVHGELQMLVSLLTALGYRPVPTLSSSSVWAHPTRTAVFVGDLIDRGPDSPGVLRLVRRMVEAGHALVVCGNHEINAVALATTDESGLPLRAHTPEKIGPHRTTLRQFAALEAEWADNLAWFRGLPAFFDFGGLRVVHAAWHGPSIAMLSQITPWTQRTLRLAHRDPVISAAREMVLNGPEIDLPPGGYFHDHSGQRRTAIRTAWWQSDRPASWASLIFPPGDVLHGIGSEATAVPPEPFYGADETPVVVGHYALPAKAPAVQAPNVACVDFGAGKGGALGCYRWDGEPVLDERKVVRVYADSR